MALTSELLASSNSTTSLWLLATAKYKGVPPFSSLLETSRVRFQQRLDLFQVTFLSCVVNLTAEGEAAPSQHDQHDCGTKKLGGWSDYSYPRSCSCPNLISSQRRRGSSRRDNWKLARHAKCLVTSNKNHPSRRDGGSLHKIPAMNFHPPFRTQPLLRPTRHWRVWLLSAVAPRLFYFAGFGGATFAASPMPKPAKIRKWLYINWL